MPPREPTMVSESLAKRNVTSGTVQFKVGSQGLVEIVVPVAYDKKYEAIALIDEIAKLALIHYYKTTRLNPRDVAQSLHRVADAIEANQRMITEDKYNGKKNRK